MMSAKPIIVEIFTKNDCCLCDYAKETLHNVLFRYNAKLIEINIEKDQRLIGLYGEKIPLILVDGEEWFKFKVSEQVLRKRLDCYIKDSEETKIYLGEKNARKNGFI